jgi:hypothetical protein
MNPRTQQQLSARSPGAFSQSAAFAVVRSNLIFFPTLSGVAVAGPALSGVAVAGLALRTINGTMSTSSGTSILKWTTCLAAIRSLLWLSPEITISGIRGNFQQQQSMRNSEAARSVGRRGGGGRVSETRRPVRSFLKSTRRRRRARHAV